jgi:pimeloyl-ACP methyl ester carboxylesterase
MAHAVAEDPRIDAFAGIAGYYAAAPQTEPISDALAERLARARVARAAYEATGEVELIPAVGPAAATSPCRLAEAFDYYGTPRGAHPNYRNAFAVQSREETLLFDAQGAAPRIKVPTLVVHSERALAPSLARSFHAALAGPKGELWLESKGQSTSTTIPP